MRRLGPVGEVAHLVVLMSGRGGGRADLRDTHERVAAGDRHPQHEIGEGQVRDQLPVTGQPVQVVDVGRLQLGVLLDQVTQSGHVGKPKAGQRAGSGYRV